MAGTERVVVHVPDAPPAIGPYSRAIKAGDTVYLSGSIGISPETKALVTGGIEEETKQVLENMKVVLTAAGTTLDRVVKTTILLRSMNDFATVNRIYAEYFPIDPPARTTFAVAGLPAGALVEIDCIALL